MLTNIDIPFLYFSFVGIIFTITYFVLYYIKMAIRDLVNLLPDAYVVYELCIRNVNSSRMTLLGKKECLITLMEEEDRNPEGIPQYNLHLPVHSELQSCRIMFNELRSMFLTENVWNASTVDARLKFLIPRVNRLYTVVDTTEHNQKVFLLNDLEELSNELSRITVPIDNPRPLSPTPPSVSSYHTIRNPRDQQCNQVHRETYNSSVWKWDLRFSGDDSRQSASEFLQNVRDYSHSRGVSETDLLRSISDLLVGSARKWYRTNTVPFINWTDFVKRFLQDFEPIYESDRLLDTIKGRMQQPNESVIQFFVTMEDLFLRLPVMLTESARVKIIRSNLLPRYVSALAVYEFYSLWDLKEYCKRIEATDICLRSRSVIPPVNRIPPNFARNFPANQFGNTRQPPPPAQNVTQQHPQFNQRIQNTGQVVPYAPRQPFPTNYRNNNYRPINNRQQYPNNQYPITNRINAITSITDNQNVLEPMFYQPQPYPFEQHQVVDEIPYQSSAHYPINNYNNPNSYANFDNPTQPVEQFFDQSNMYTSNSVDTSTLTQNQQSSGNEQRTDVNGPAAVPNV